MTVRNIVALVLTAALLAACSGIRHYSDTYEKNLLIETTTESGSMFSSVDAALEIYRVDDQCRVEYQGTVRLDRSPVEVGIPEGRPSYLVFAFASSSFLGSSKSSIAYETLLNPRTGHRYEIAVSYADDMYDVGIRERNVRSGGTRPVDIRRLEACVAG